MQLSPSVDLAPFVFLAVVAVAGVAVLAAVLYLDHRKTMALIESGQYADAREDSRAWILVAGLLLVAVGTGTAIEAIASGDPVSGVTAALVGVAALAYYFLKRREGRDTRGVSAERADH